MPFVTLVACIGTLTYTHETVAATAVAELQEVIVTATRREQSILNVPIAISAVTEDAIERLSADDFIDLARTVPGLSFTNLGPGRNRVAIRGISVLGGENAIGYYIDETPIPKTQHGAILNTTIDPRLFDINRVEVLRGPQGTLYGQSSMGGTVRLIPNRPDTNNFFGSAGGAIEVVTDGSPLFAVDAMLNLPVVADKIGIRSIVYFREGGGFIDRRYLGEDGQPTPDDDVGAQVRNTVTDVNSESTLGARIIADFIVSDNWRITPMVMYEDMTIDGYQDITAGDINPTDQLVQEFPFNTAEVTVQEWTLLNLKIEGNFSNVNFISSTSSFTRLFAANEEGGSVTQFFLGNAFNGNTGEQGIKDHDDFTQEIRFSSINPVFDRFHWLIGGYYEEKDTSRWIDWHAVGSEAALGPAAADDNLFTQDGENDFYSLAGFGEVSFKFIDTLTATAGIRHYDIEQQNWSTTAGFFSGGGGTGFTSSHDKGEQYRFNLAFQADDRHNYYMQAAEGFRPGFGASNVFPPACDAELASLGIDPDNVPQQVFPDGVWNYELGFKTISESNRFQFNGAVYKIDWSDIQQRTRLQSCGFNFQSNAGQATSQGVEIETVMRPNEVWEFTGMVSYVDATLDNDNLSLSAESGERILEVPEWTAAATAQYSFPMVANFDGYVRTDVTYTGKSYADFLQNEGNPFSVLDELTLVNLRFAAQSETFEIALYGRNIFNEEGRISRARAGLIDVPGRPRFVINRPREIGISFKKSF